MPRSQFSSWKPSQGRAWKSHCYGVCHGKGALWVTPGVMSPPCLAFTPHGHWCRLGWVWRAGLLRVTWAFLQMARVRESSLDSSCLPTDCFASLTLSCLSCSLLLSPLDKTGIVFSASHDSCGQERSMLVGWGVRQPQNCLTASRLYFLMRASGHKG